MVLLIAPVPRRRPRPGDDDGGTTEPTSAVPQQRAEGFLTGARTRELRHRPPRFDVPQRPFERDDVRPPVGLDATDGACSEPVQEGGPASPELDGIIETRATFRVDHDRRRASRRAD